MRTHPPTLLPLPTFNHFINRVVADTDDFVVAANDPFVAGGIVYFELPADGITALKVYTATFKFRLGNDWQSGDIVPFTLLTSRAPIVVNVIVR
jgi:hypothetical protein